MIRTAIVRAASFLTIYIALSLNDGAVSTQQVRPPFEPRQSLDSFRIASGFRIELFAADPLIASPVAMEVDERGDLFVVEMPGYPLDVSGSGRVKRLTDTNGDGLPDRAAIFADGLRLPTGIMKWKNGLLVTDSPHVWYFEDADGDGHAEIKRQVLTGFALSNPQHTTNAPVYGLDNWIYLANEGPVRTIRYRDLFGDAGGEVRFPDLAAGPRLPPDAGGRNVRFRPETHELEMLSSRSQFGQTFDAFGRHFLVVHNRHIIHEVIAARYLARNPALVVQSAVEHVPDYPQPAALFPITRTPEFQLLTDVGVMTSASGLASYEADLFPPEYHGAMFVAEGAHNLLHVAAVRERGATFSASRMFDGREFLASTDAWFRPVNLYLGPDGALYVIDYYRKVLEHPEWMAEAALKPKDLYAGQDRGRIYRIVPAAAPGPNWLGRIGLGNSSSQELVALLARPNLWWRRHAQRLLVDRRPPDVAAALASMAVGNESPMARVHALWTLDGLGRLEPSVVAQALRDPVGGVRENAIRLAEIHLPRHPSLAQALVGAIGDADPRVRFQLLLTLGDVSAPEAEAVRTNLLFDHVDDEWMQIAALSARSVDESRLMQQAIERLGETESRGARILFTRLGSLAAGAKSADPAAGLLRTVLSREDGDGGWWRAATLSGLASAILPEQSAALDSERQRAAELIARERSPEVRHALLALLERTGLPDGAETDAVVGWAERTAVEPEEDPEARADAVRLLALRDVTQYEPMLLDILARAEPTPVHVAAVRALSEQKGERLIAMLLKLWERWTPTVREEVLRTIVREPARVRVLLDAVAAGKVAISEIEWPLRVRMMMSDDEVLRSRARTLFGRAGNDGRTVQARYRAAATMGGDIARGQRVFSRHCATCHQYRGGSGVPFGPDLGEVRGRLPSALLTDILRPNQSIADGYELWVAELADGTTITGVIAAETSSSVTFRQPGGSETIVARPRITAMRVAPLSAMPERLESQITVQQMADLIAFIKGGG